MYTTLNQIREHSPCSEGWTNLLKFIGKKKADDESVSIRTILESNGLDDALWCLRAVKGQDKAIRLYAVWCARQVQHLMTDQRSINALDVSEKYAKGEATEAALNAAAWAASDSARAAWDAASDAAWDAAWGAARAAWDAARDAAWAAARAAAWAAARAASDAARAASDAQKQELIRICIEIEANS